MSETYTAAIIGLGRVGSLLEKDPKRPKPNTHAGFYSANDRVSLIAGSDSDQSRLKEFGSDWKIGYERLYPKYHDMLEREKADLVSICAFADTRKEMVRRCLENGARGLWIEKALGFSLDDANGIAADIENAGAKAIVDYPRRMRAGYREIKNAIEDGRFGKLQTITAHFAPQLIHTGTHAFDVLRFWCGEALSIAGTIECAQIDPTDLADGGGTATIEMENGSTVFVSARRKEFYIFQFDLVFDKARILYGNDIAKLYLPDDSENYTGFLELFERSPFPLYDPIGKTMLDDLIDCLTNGNEPICSVRNAVESLRIALAIFQSHIEKRPLAPGEVDTSMKVANV